MKLFDQIEVFKTDNIDELVQKINNNLGFEKITETFKIKNMIQNNRFEIWTNIKCMEITDNHKITIINENCIMITHKEYPHCPVVLCKTINGIKKFEIIPNFAKKLENPDRIVLYYATENNRIIICNLRNNKVTIYENHYGILVPELLENVHVLDARDLSMVKEINEPLTKVEVLKDKSIVLNNKYQFKTKDGKIIFQKVILEESI